MNNLCCRNIYQSIICIFIFISCSDSLPGRQASLDILRNSGDFVQYILTVANQKLTQVSNHTTIVRDTLRGGGGGGVK